MSIPVREQAAVLALTAASTAEWYKTATLIVEAGGALALLEGRIGTLDEGQRETAGLPRVELTPCLRGRGPCWKDQQHADPIPTRVPP